MSKDYTNEYLIERAVEGVNDTCFEHCVSTKECDHEEIVQLLKERFLSV
jgi:hypothetical protein